MSDECDENLNFEYNAFLSYTSRIDYRLVRKLEAFLESFHRIKNTQEFDFPKLEICRDGSDFSITKFRQQARELVSTGDTDSEEDEIQRLIVGELEKSQYLIVIWPGKESASYWIEWELKWWLNNRSAETVLFAVSQGEPASDLRGFFGTFLLDSGVARSKWYDLRGFYKKQSHNNQSRDFDDERIQLAADLIGLSAGDVAPVWYRDQRRKARVRSVVALVVATVILTIGSVAMWSFQRKAAAEAISLRSELGARASTAVMLGSNELDEDPGLAAAFAARSLKLSPSEGARILLGESLVRLPAYRTLRVHAGPSSNNLDRSGEEGLHLLNPSPEIAWIKWSADGAFLVLATKEEGSEPVIWQTDPGLKVDGLEFPNPIVDFDVSVDGESLLVLDQSGDLSIYRFSGPGFPSRETTIEGNMKEILISGVGTVVARVGNDELALLDLESTAVTNVPFQGLPVSGAMTPDSACFAVLSDRGEIRVFERAHGDLIGALVTGLMTSDWTYRDEMQFLLASIIRREPQFDALGEEVDSLNITGRATDLLMVVSEQDPNLRKTISEAGESISDSVATGKDGSPNASMSLSGKMPTELLTKALQSEVMDKTTPADILFGPDANCLIVSKVSDTFLELEIWDIKGENPEMVQSFSGLFSKFDLSDSGEDLVIVGVNSMAIFGLKRLRDGRLIVDRVETRPLELKERRLGVPRSLTLSAKGNLVLSSFAPFLQMMGANPSQVFLELVDSKQDIRTSNRFARTEINPHNWPVPILSFSRDSKRVASYSANGIVRIWKTSGEDELFGRNGETTETFNRSAVSGDWFVPGETLQILDRAFETDTELLAATSEVTPCELDSDLIQKHGLGDLDLTRGVHQLSNQNAASSPSLIPLGQKLDQRLERGQIAFQPRVETAHKPSVSPEGLPIDELIEKVLRSEPVADFSTPLAASLQELPVLLSGSHVEKLLNQIRDDETSLRAVVLVGLSGNKRATKELEEVKAASSSRPFLEVLEWAIRHLDEFGRDVSLTGIPSQVAPENLKPTDLLCYPTYVEGKLDFERTLDVVRNDEVSRRAIVDHRFNPHESFAPMAFAIWAVGRDKGYFLSKIAEVYQEVGRLAEAQEFADAASIEDPDSADIENLLGNLAVKNKEYSKAQDHYLKSIKLGRKDGWPECNLGRLYSNTGDLELAEKFFREAIGRKSSARSESEYAEFLNDFAWFVVTERGDEDELLEEALKRSKESNEITSRSDPGFLDTLAAIHFRRGDREEAMLIQEEAIEKAIVSHPEMVEELRETLRLYQ